MVSYFFLASKWGLVSRLKLHSVVGIVVREIDSQEKRSEVKENESYFSICVLLIKYIAEKLKILPFVSTYYARKCFPVENLKLQVLELFW